MLLALTILLRVFVAGVPFFCGKQGRAARCVRYGPPLWYLLVGLLMLPRDVTAQEAVADAPAMSGVKQPGARVAVLLAQVNMLADSEDRSKG